MADKNDYFSEMALIFKALGDTNRLRILSCLMHSTKESLTVSEIVERVNLSQPLVSHHLKELRHAGILVCKRKGPFIYYRPAYKELTDLLKQSALIFNISDGDEIIF